MACGWWIWRPCNPKLVPSAVADRAGLGVRSGRPASGLVAGLRTSACCLLLDTCEHVVDAGGQGDSVGSQRAPGVDILARAGSPLGVAASRIRLGPLRGPPASFPLTPAKQRSSPRYSCSRACHRDLRRLRADGVNVPQVVEICQRLDGIPLAIEFAAPHVTALGSMAWPPAYTTVCRS